LIDEVNEVFPIQARRVIPSMTIMVVVGVLAALAGVISGFTKGISPLDRPIPLLFLLLCVPTIWIVTLGILATFSLRITQDSAQKVLWRRWVVVSKPLSQLRSARFVRSSAGMGPQTRVEYWHWFRFPPRPLGDR
jgi:hypothetical protein